MTELKDAGTMIEDGMEVPREGLKKYRVTYETNETYVREVWASDREAAAQIVEKEEGGGEWVDRRFRDIDEVEYTGHWRPE